MNNLQVIKDKFKLHGAKHDDGEEEDEEEEEEEQQQQQQGIRKKKRKVSNQYVSDSDSDYIISSMPFRNKVIKRK